MESKGLFITIEGPDGAGKSTQIESIRSYLGSRGYDTVVTREPGGTPISEKIRDIILDKENNEMTNMTEALLYAAARSQHVSQVIKPALAAGKAVVCDRFVDSSFAYQGFGRHLGEAVGVINSYAVEGCMPDVTFLFKMQPGVGKSRIRFDQQDRLEMEKLEFHQTVYKGYEQLEKMYPERIIGIDASGSIDDIKRKIISELSRILR